jgi:hypothetical protein
MEVFEIVIALKLGGGPRCGGTASRRAVTVPGGARRRRSRSELVISGGYTRAHLRQRETPCALSGVQLS